MNFETLHQYCLSFPDAEETFPFDQDTLVFKVKGKMFALVSLRDWESGNARINIKCDPEEAIELREKYDAVNPGYHMSKKHWNTVQVEGDVPWNILQKMISNSYHLVRQSLPKKLR